MGTVKRNYVDKDGLVVFVSEGISGLGKHTPEYGVYRMKANGHGLQRIKSKNLPLRKSFNAVQADLYRYAEVKGWKAC